MGLLFTFGLKKKKKGSSPPRLPQKCSQQLYHNSPRAQTHRCVPAVGPAAREITDVHAGAPNSAASGRRRSTMLTVGSQLGHTCRVIPLRDVQGQAKRVVGLVTGKAPASLPPCPPALGGPGQDPVSVWVLGYKGRWKNS